MESDEEDMVFFGTPITREEDITTTRKKKSVAEASGQLRTLPPWKQEVRDEEGRRRFHGAFSGGYSAGYYNTVGSKEGWAPQTFTSSRKNRAEIIQQSIFNFLDDDERSELEADSLGTSMQFDTFGFTAAEIARKQAENEQQQRPSAIPGPIPDEVVLPATDSIGVKLLLKMGWRHGHSIKDSRTDSLYGDSSNLGCGPDSQLVPRAYARREARKAFLALSSKDASTQLAAPEQVEGDLEDVKELPSDINQYSESTPVYVLNPKQDLHGLGFDPFRNAPEFREKKSSRLSETKELGLRKPLGMRESLFGFNSNTSAGRTAPGFGIGALEELDAEDEDVYASGYAFEENYVQEIEEPSRLAIEHKKKSGEKGDGALPGFKVASNSDYQLERFSPPVIPKDFVPRHKFPAPLEVNYKLADVPPVEVPPPEDNNLKVLVEGVATLVARCGKLFEDLSREKNQSNPLFSFLYGGNGHDYYSRKLWEERQKRNDQTKQQSNGNMFPSAKKMTAESRGEILGEKPLERSTRDLSSSASSADTISLQFNLSDTFTNPASFTEPQEIAKPFRDDPAKQERFERYLKDKYRGGLRSKDSGGASNMSEAARARERLEFETAADAIQKGKWGSESWPANQQLLDLSTATGLQFTSAGVEQAGVGQAQEMMMKEMYPKREEFQWRPSPVLCKRFDLLDPYMGKPPPPPRMRSKMDALIFMPDSVKDAKVEETAALRKDLFSESKEVTDIEAEVEVEAENVERPVDLYKAIFSDDSDEEEENSYLNQVEDPQKKVEVVNTTLSRLIAGDFLESLGKELGLEVPPDVSGLENKAGISSIYKENANANKGDSSSLSAVSGSYADQGVPQGKTYNREASQVIVSDKHEGLDVNTYRSGNKTADPDSSLEKSGKVKLEKVVQEDKNAKTPMGKRGWSSGSSDDDRSRRKSSSRHRRRSSNSDGERTDSSDDYRDRYHSRSKGTKKLSSRDHSSSRKHSKHRKHRSGDTSSRSSRHGSEKDHREAKRDKRKWKD
ncbi:hypothetical protein RJ639_027881 [Escallonia herrerae]|uniref:SURP motif domain-containing protein n=1 Tax=Escallonia herrerae TaxID=1293975 RepID=A0AA88X7B2_9ASTE|nr:hypothetical protein RJ639_027881 [Escallonia herrerae]